MAATPERTNAGTLPHVATPAEAAPPNKSLLIPGPVVQPGLGQAVIEGQEEMVTTDDAYDSPIAVRERELERQRAEAEGEALAQDANHVDHSGERPGEQFEGPPSEQQDNASPVPPNRPAESMARHGETAQASGAAQHSGSDPGVTASCAPPSMASRALAQMPECFRAAFPPLSVDVHAYNPDPQRRFVQIAGRRYREGDHLIEGPQVLEIVPDGIVFQWHDERVVFALQR